jgi:hypothetical protein
MAIDVSSLQDFSDAESLKLARYARAHILAGGQSYTIGTRTYYRAQLAEIEKMIARLEAAVACDDDGDTALVIFGDPQ